MEKDVRTIPADAVLEDAIYQMRHYKIGVLPVVDNGQLVGIITNNDIFDAFLNIAGYDQGGTTVTIKVTQNVAGFLAKVSDALAEHNYNILTLMVTDRADIRLIELHVDTTDATGVKAALTGAGFELI